MSHARRQPGRREFDEPLPRVHRTGGGMLQRERRRDDVAYSGTLQIAGAEHAVTLYRAWAVTVKLQSGRRLRRMQCRRRSRR
jgi:hypothetical protein